MPKTLLEGLKNENSCQKKNVLNNPKHNAGRRCDFQTQCRPALCFLDHFLHNLVFFQHKGDKAWVGMQVGQPMESKKSAHSTPH
jgi:hypothetical protein